VKSAPSRPRSPLQSRLALYLDLIRWNRPAGWLLLLWPTLSALWLASNGFPGWHLLVVFILMRSAGCCINDVADRDFDRHVKRTAARPVTTGAVSVKAALVLGAVLALLAFALVLTTNAITIGISGAALAITLAYPYAKRFVSMPQAVLGVAFGMGIPMAFAAVLGEVPRLAWLLMLGNLFWVLAYDTEYAMVDRDDDLSHYPGAPGCAGDPALLPCIYRHLGCGPDAVCTRRSFYHSICARLRPSGVALHPDSQPFA
jgi:4-hydroxybenzoate polyprenyltransferase